MEKILGADKGKMLTLLLVLFGNLWIWKVFEFNVSVGLLVVLSIYLLYLSITTNKFIHKVYFILTLFIIVLFQLRETTIRSLTMLNNDEQRVQHQRLKEYPPVKISLYGKTLWIPAAHWLEGRTESIAFFRVLDNMSEVLDPNLYFFANHPRERIGVSEFEKFPYLLLPFFVLGIIHITKKKLITPMLALLLPAVLSAVVGNKIELGPISLIPFIVVSTYVGVHGAYEYIKKSTIYSNLAIYGFLFLYLIVIIQIYSYATF